MKKLFFLLAVLGTTVVANAAWVKTSTLAVGDSVVLISEAESMELTGFSTTSTVYGIGTAYTGQPAATLVWEVVAGSKENTFAFKNGENYLIWTSGNSLKGDGTAVEDATSWEVTFDEAKNAKIMNVTSNDAAKDPRQISYNKQNPRFANYKQSTAAGYPAVQLCKNVKEVEATAITIDTTEQVTLELYRELQLVATLTPAEATTSVEWTSANDSIVSVSKTGLIAAEAVHAEPIEIKATAGAVNATCKVLVVEPTILTCAQAAEKALSVAKDNERYEGGRYVVQGYITAISTEEKDFAKDKTISLSMADTKDGEATFALYANTPESGKMPNVGDKIEVVGYLTKYKEAAQIGRGGKFKVIEASALDNVEANEAAARKVVENGQIYIIKDGVRYNIFGAMVE